MAFFKVISSSWVVYQQADNKFKLMSWFNRLYKNNFENPVVVHVNEDAFQYPVLVKQLASGVEVAGSYTVEQIKAFIDKEKAFEQAVDFKSIIKGHEVEIFNRSLDLVLKINTIEPFPIIDTTQLQQAMSC